MLRTVINGVIFVFFFFFLSIAKAQTCELNRTILFAGNDWDSSNFNVEIARYILEHGYDCKTATVHGTTIPLLNAIVRGDVDINMELWKANNVEIWNKMKKTGLVIETKGISITAATQNFYVPRYVVKGDIKHGIKALAPELKGVEDLKKYALIFKDPEDPYKGRFYNCKIGWNCELVNTKKLVAYGLAPYFNNFQTGSAEALRSEIISTLKRGKPIFFYYWSPTYLIGKYHQDLQIIKEPPFNQQKWKKLEDSKTGAGVQAVAYPTMQISIIVNKRFAEKTPKLMSFFDNYRLSEAIVNQGIVYMHSHNDKSGQKAAINFLKTNPLIWQKWLPESIAKKINIALNAKQNVSHLVNFGLIITANITLLLLIVLSFVIIKGRFTQSRLVFVMMIIVSITLLTLWLHQGTWFITTTPKNPLFPIVSAIDNFINWLVTQYGDVLRNTISSPILLFIGSLNRFLSQHVSWFFITVLFTILAYHASKRIQLTLFVFASLVVIWGLQLWAPTIQTLTLMLVAITLTLVVGLPLGIATGLNKGLRYLISPLLDLMQTMPSFVYLIPVVMLFGLGTFAGVIATAIYATPPLIRLTSLGIRLVDSEVIEAAEAFGASPLQILIKIQLPLAMPNIMVGLNQAIVMALSMVVIASMIGVQGLGQEVLLGLQRQDLGIGFTAGLSIVLVSIILDRITQAYGKRLQSYYHLQG
jgi:glycine betaine/proline transport system permease protein/glycine betaine/proline transport system substrate-binding protein